MKNVGVFYLILMVLLSVMPCNDEMENKKPAKSTTAIVSPEKDNCSTENCLSICSCTCCGQSVLAIEFTSLSIKISIIERTKLNSSYHFKLEQMAQNIWQPPKLS